MPTEITVPPTARDGSVSGTENQPSANAHASDWTVTVASAAGDKTTSPAPRPDAAGKPLAKPIVKPPLAHAPDAAGKPLAKPIVKPPLARGASPSGATPKAAGSATPVKPSAKPLVKPPLAHEAGQPHAAAPAGANGEHKPPVKVHHAAPRKADLDKLMAPPRPGKTLPVALGLAAVLAVAGIAFNLHSKQKAAEQRAAQAYATVTGFLSRVDGLTRQAAPFQQQLDRAISDLQALSSSASGGDAQPRIAAAISTVANVEQQVFDGETDEEQIRQALSALAGRPDQRELAAKVQAASAARKSQQQAFDAKCQKLRALIVAAQRK